jgi:hypothetical protein
MSRDKAAKFALALYLLGAVGVLSNFLLTPHDGTADLAMVAWTLPAALVGLFTVYWPFKVAFPFMPAAFGYYGGHLAFFLPSVTLIAFLIWRIIRGKRS